MHSIIGGMNPRIVLPIAPGSPFHGWAPPDISHCEANLPAWIAAPADTWSNLAYLAVGLWLWRRAARDGSSAGSAMGPIAIAVGLCSFVFHASYTFVFQVLDHAGMFIYIVWVLVHGFSRLGWLEAASRRRAYWAGVAASVAALLGLHRLGGPVQAVFGAQAAAAAGLEGWLFLKRREGIDYAPLGATVGLFLLGQFFWHLDHTSLFCRPDDHFLQGHAIWHLITAFCFATSYAFYRQFDAEKS